MAFDLQGSDLQTVSLDEAIELISKKAAKGPSKRGGKAALQSGKSKKSLSYAPGFTLFSEQRKKELRKQGGSSRGSELASRLGEEWMGLSEEDQQGFAEAEQDKKDGLLPKAQEPSKRKALTGYSLFCKERREEVRAGGGSGVMPVQDIAKQLGAEWRSTSEQQKSDFKNRAAQGNLAQAPQQIEQHGGAYSGQKQPQQMAKEVKASRLEAPSKPKAISGYNLFCKERRAELRACSETEAMSPQDVMKQLGSEWNSQSQEQKSEFQRRASEGNLARALQQEEEPGHAGDVQRQPVKMAKDKQAKSQTLSKAKTMSGYNLFCKERRMELRAGSQTGAMSPQDIMKQLGSEWNTQSEQQKQEFKDRALHFTEG